MTFDLLSARPILARTTAGLEALLRDLPDDWVRQNEGPGTWSPFDVVGHLIHGEKTDWIPRARIILEHGGSKAFEPFDRFGMLHASRDKSMNQLLDEFAQLRSRNLSTLDALQITPQQLSLEGRHPELGRVTLGQLFATWVVHDLGHIAQIARVMAKSYRSAVGPWSEYLPILNRGPVH
ncbi:MAG TPA: DinB family protein [Acidobacteriota bacterium]